MTWFTAAFAAVSLAVTAAAVPGAIDLPRYAFGDNGWAVRVNGLLDEGLVPTRDFAFTYGLLTLLVNRAVFAAFGATPAATGGLSLACGLLLAVGVWRLARAMNLGVGPRLLLLLLLPIVVNAGQLPSPAHALEPVFLVFALAAQARGRLAEALAVCTVGVLVKPGLGYLLGAMLLIDLLSSPARRWKSLLPAAVVGSGGVALLVAAFGLEPVLRTQIPTEAGKVYRDQNCGLIRGDGRLFLTPEPGTELMYFTTTPAGVWVVATAVLLVGGLAAAPRWRADRAARTVLTAAALHAAFALFFFGNRWGWTYYPFLPFVGAALAADRIPRWTPGDLGKLLTPIAAGVLALLAASVSALYFGLGTARALRVIESVGDGSGLTTTHPGLAEAWRALEREAKSGRVFVLTRAGCPGALIPGVESPRSWYLSRAVAVPGELARVRAQIEACDCLVVPDWHDHDLLTWPELAPAATPFAAAEDHGVFTLYRRAVSPGR